MKNSDSSSLKQTIININRLLTSAQKKSSILMVLLMMVNAALDVIGLGMIYPLIDAALNHKLIETKPYLNYFYQLFSFSDPVAFILAIALTVLAILLIKNIFSLIIYYIQTRFAFGIALSMNRKMFYSYYKNGFLFLNDKSSGEKLYDVKQAPEIFAQNILMRLLSLFNEYLILFFILVGLIIYNPSVIFLFLCVIAPVFLFFYFAVNNEIKRLGKKYQDLFPISSNAILESLKAYVDVKLVNKEQKFMNRFLKIQKEIFDVVVWRNTLQTAPSKFYDLTLVIGVITILFVAWIFPNHQATIIPTLSLFALSAYRIIPAINKILTSLLEIKNKLPVFEILNLASDDHNNQFDKVKFLPFQEKLKLKNIQFSYNGENPVLKNVDFEVKKGETVGIIGSSGSGKTTLINIILRLLKEDNGYLSVDGLRIEEIHSGAFQRIIGYVPQEVFIIDGTLKENVAFGVNEEDFEEELLMKSIEAAMLSEFVDLHPEGINMRLGEDGVKLSGGQKQRVGIARALYKDSEILVFDEITSSLDMETEDGIIETIKALTNLNKTTFIIAHRITTLSTCDRIYELENGSIKRILKYQELFKEKLTA